jgi:predicted DNA binding CopG/RHH family protein
MKTQPTAMHTKITVRMTDKQLKSLQKTAKQHNMNVAEYVRACVL